MTASPFLAFAAAIVVFINPVVLADMIAGDQHSHDISAKPPSFSENDTHPFSSPVHPSSPNYETFHALYSEFEQDADIKMLFDTHQSKTSMNETMVQFWVDLLNRTDLVTLAKILTSAESLSSEEMLLLSRRPGRKESGNHLQLDRLRAHVFGEVGVDNLRDITLLEGLREEDVGKFFELGNALVEILRKIQFLEEIEKQLSLQSSSNVDDVVAMERELAKMNVAQERMDSSESEEEKEKVKYLEPLAGEYQEHSHMDMNKKSFLQEEVAQPKELKTVLLQQDTRGDHQDEHEGYADLKGDRAPEIIQKKLPQAHSKQFPQARHDTVEKESGETGQKLNEKNHDPSKKPPAAENPSAAIVDKIHGHDDNHTLENATAKSPAAAAAAGDPQYHHHQPESDYDTVVLIVVYSVLFAVCIFFLVAVLCKVFQVCKLARWGRGQYKTLKS